MGHGARSDALRLVVETEPAVEDVRVLEDGLTDFNAEATGILDAAWLAIFLRGDDGAALGGAYGWTWGGTCHLRYLFLPASLRGRGQGTALMRAVEEEARARGCTQMFLETHDFQAPKFYQRLGFAMVAELPNYPRGHRSLIMAKALA
jgi:GNAT superfamily N-acetyltransferase